MAYAVGIDLGTTYTAAATAVDGRIEIATLSNRAAEMPTVVFLRDDETLLSGDPALRRGAEDPTRFAREFKRRLGDEIPIMLGHSPYSAERLMAVVVQDVLARVTERQGGPPSGIAISYPANWGPYKVELLRQASTLSGFASATLITEPEAAAAHYATVERVEPGQTVAVYDLGGGTFDAAVLRRTTEGFEILGEPSGIERLGGIDFDAAVFEHVRRSLGTNLEELDQSDPTIVAALATIRDGCVAAKEALSDDVDATVRVMLPSIQTSVRITRSEFEDMIRPVLRETIEALRRTVQSAGIRPDELTSVLLVGGSSRIPLVGEMVSQELGRPVAVDAHPKHVVALGAARLAAASQAVPAGVGLPTQTQLVSEPELSPVEHEAPEPITPTVSAAQPVPPPVSGSRSRLPIVIGGALLLVGLAAAAFFLTRGDDSDGVVIADDEAGDVVEDEEADLVDDETTTSTSTTTTAAATTTTTTATTTTAAATTTTAAATTTTAAVTTTSFFTGNITCALALAPSGLCAAISDITIVNGFYRATFETSGFIPRIEGFDSDFVAGDNHLHFFFDSTLPANAGVNGDPIGDWLLWGLADGDGQFVFDAFAPSSNRTGASRMCVVVVDENHNVLDDGQNGNCVDLPT